MMEGLDVARNEAHADLIGERVVLHGLSARGQKMNGMAGRITSFADGRYVLQLDGPEGKLVKVKPANVKEEE